MLPMLLLLYLSTMYTREHYFVDVPSGIVVGIFFFLVGDWVKGKIDTFGFH